ncbi:MAG TPA: tetratricopeptide repeat protein [Thermoleophilaceae bacterium]|nr:tetratricopeptide repeat protein [Thermoleophilaceae bacterium]
MFELIASWSEDIGNLTGPLAIVALALVFSLYRNEIRGFLANASKLRVQEPGGELEMTSQRDSDSEDAETSEPAESASSADPNEELNAPKTEVEGAAATDADYESETDTDKLRVRMGNALEAKDEEKAEAIFKRLQQVEENPVQGKVDQGLRLWLRFVFKFEPDALVKLEELAADERVAAHMYLFRGYCLSRAGNTSGAASELKRARDAATSSDVKTRATIFYAKELDKAGDQAQSLREIETALRECEDPSLRASLWRALAELYEQHDQHELRALALQKALEAAPDNARLRLDVAYAYSHADESDFGPLVIHHYETALSFEPTYETARNNLGVAYNHADLTILSAKALKRASDDGSGLATGNLAFRYLNAGFADQAEELVKEATKGGSPLHAKVAEASADIAQRRESENEQRTRLSALGQRQAAFLSDYAEAQVKPATSLLGTWRFQDSGDEVTVTGENDSLLGGVDCRREYQVEVRGNQPRADRASQGLRDAVLDLERKARGAQLLDPGAGLRVPNR